MGSFLHSQQFTASCIRTHQLKDAASQYVFLLHRLLRSFTKLLLLYWRARVTPYIFVSVIYYQDLARKQHLGGSSDHKISCFRVYNTWNSSLKNFKCTIRNILIFVQLLLSFNVVVNEALLLFLVDCYYCSTTKGTICVGARSYFFFFLFFLLLRLSASSGVEHCVLVLYMTSCRTWSPENTPTSSLPSVDRSSHVHVWLERKLREIQGLRIQFPRIPLRRGTFSLQLCMSMGLVSFKENINLYFRFLTLFLISDAFASNSFCAFLALASSNNCCNWLLVLPLLAISSKTIKLIST